MEPQPPTRLEKGIAVTQYTVIGANGLWYTISWDRNAAWGEHWAVSHGGREIARYGAYTEARKAVAA